MCGCMAGMINAVGFVIGSQELEAVGSICKRENWRISGQWSVIGSRDALKCYPIRIILFCTARRAIEGVEEFI